MTTAEALLFPARPVWSRTTRQRLARAALAYAALVAVALLLPRLTAVPALHALGLGLAVPGGWLLLWAGGEGGALHLALAVVTLATFAGACGLWFATGNVLAPGGVWLASALGGAAMGLVHHHHEVWSPALLLVPAAGGGALLLGLAGAVVLAGAGLRQRRRHNARLQTPEPETSSRQRTCREVPASPGELDAHDLALLRLLLDRALQPIDRFDGFEWLDQFQTAAVRYQINMVSYALSMAQAVHTPAFSGYLNQAQHRLAAKQQDHRVWRYWALENLWGNLRRDPDPVPRDNIMFTGFLAAQLAWFQAASGERSFDAPGSLVFAHPDGRRFAYDLPQLCTILAQGFRTAPFGLIPCEPNWIYPLCNSIGAAGLSVQDNLAGTRLWAEAEPGFVHALETEFVTPAGEFVPCRSAHLGVAMPQIGGVVGQAFPCFFLNAAAPAIARRHWRVLRRRLDEAGFRRNLWRVDVGNYRFNRASSYAATAAAAVELGDPEIAARLLGALDEDHPLRIVDGAGHRPGVSLWAHAAEVLARTGRADALRSLVCDPPRRPLARPHLAEAVYPDVLVASAHERDGALHAVLHPGRAPGPQPLGFAGLRPGSDYRLDAAGLTRTVLADHQGRARIDLSLDGRTELRLAPAAGAAP